jgi:prophage regulatory protein
MNPDAHQLKSVDLLLSDSEVGQITTLSRTTRWRMKKTGAFPEPIRIGNRRSAYRASDIASWLESRSQASDKDRSAIITHNQRAA